MEGWMVGRIDGRLGDRWRDGRIGRGIKDAGRHMRGLEIDIEGQLDGWKSGLQVNRRMYMRGWMDG